MHVQDSLEGYETLVVDELDQELGTTEDMLEQAEMDAAGAGKSKDYADADMDMDIDNGTWHGKDSDGEEKK